MCAYSVFLFFFSSRRRHTRSLCDWSSDVCSSDIVSQLGGAGEKNLSIDDYAGLSERQPFVAAMLSIYLLSLLGLPVTAGFFGKFYIFKAAVNSHLISLAVLMAINSVIGAYYYLRVIVVMYMREPSAEAAAAGAVPSQMRVDPVLLSALAGSVLS